jgi:hypothetical protein
MGLAAGTASAATSPAAAAGWRPGPAGIHGTTTAVAGVRASGVTTEFAFVDNATAKADVHTMYVRTNGKAWTKESGPKLATGESVVSAKALSASHLVVFTVLANRSSRVLTDTKGKWAVIGKFGSPVGTATVLSGSDIWVFGNSSFSPVKPLGVLHYNGKSWTRVGASAGDGTGVSATSAWAVKGTTVEHFARGAWTGANLVKLIPTGGQLSSKRLIGVYSAPGAPLYAVGTGGAQDQGGPLVVLELVGKNWKKVATYPSGYPQASAISTDGKGGLIIGGSADPAEPALLLHYAKGSGKLVPQAAPGMTNAKFSVFFTAANVPGTAVNIIGGVTGEATGRATFYTTN